jgi:hypothetical protein
LKPHRIGAPEAIRGNREVQRAYLGDQEVASPAG